MRYKTPIEARKALDIRVRIKLAEIPSDMRSPIPVAEWLDNPKSFCKQRFIRETVSFLERVYGFEQQTYQYPVTFLADEMETYICATIGFIESGSKIVVNGKQSPWLKIRDSATLNIIRLSRELGLTPASRLPSNVLQMAERSIYDILPFPRTKQGKDF